MNRDILLQEYSRIAETSVIASEAKQSETLQRLEIASTDSVGLAMTAWRNERGTALVISMIFLGLLTTLGLYAIFNSTTELTSSAQYKSNKEAFYAAEGAIEYVKGDGYYFTTKTTASFPDTSHPTAGARDLSANGTNATGSVTYTTSGNPPPGYGFSAKDTMASYFVINATGTANSGVQNRQEEGVAKILPKS